MATILPVKRHFAEKKIVSLSQVITYDRAIHETHRIKPILWLPDNSLDHLGVDVNLALASYSRWRLKVDARTQSEIKAR